MAPVIPIISTYIAGALGLGTFGALLIEVGLYYVVGRWAYNRLNRRPGPDYQTPFNARLQYLNEPNAPRRIVYGDARLAGTVVAQYSDSKKLCMLVALAPHRLEDEIVDILVNDQPFFTEAELGFINSRLDSNSWTAITPGTANGAEDNVSELRRQINDRARRSSLPVMGMGRNFQAPDIGNLGSTRNFHSSIGSTNDILLPIRWGNDGSGVSSDGLEMRMSGISWVVFSFPRSPRSTDISSNDPDVWNRIPTISFRVRRPNSSLRVPPGVNPDNYTRGNSGLVAYDYIHRYTEYSSPVCGVNRIDDASFIAAANFCEARNLTCNGVVDLTSPPSDVMDQICLAANGGVFGTKAGVISFSPGAPAAATATFTDDDFQQDSATYAPLTDINSRVSSVVASYVDAEGTEQSVGVRQESSDINVSRDMQLDLVNSRLQAENAARIQLSQIWHGAAFSFVLIDPRREIAPNDKIHITGGGALDLDDDFRVVSVSRDTKGNRLVRCAFEDPTLFDEKPLGTEIIPPSRLPNFVPGSQFETFHLLVNGQTNRLLVRNTEGHITFFDYRAGSDFTNDQYTQMQELDYAPNPNLARGDFLAVARDLGFAHPVTRRGTAAGDLLLPATTAADAKKQLFVSQSGALEVVKPASSAAGWALVYASPNDPGNSATLPNFDLQDWAYLYINFTSTSGNRGMELLPIRGTVADTDRQGFNAWFSANNVLNWSYSGSLITRFSLYGLRK